MKRYVVLFEGPEDVAAARLADHDVQLAKGFVMGKLVMYTGSMTEEKAELLRAAEFVVAEDVPMRYA